MRKGDRVCAEHNDEPKYMSVFIIPSRIQPILTKKICRERNI